MSTMSLLGTHLSTCDPHQNSSSSISVPDPGKDIFEVVDHGSDLLAEDCGLPIDMISSSLAQLLAFNYCLEKDLLQVDFSSYSIDEESSPKFAQYYYSLCCQGQVRFCDRDMFNSIVGNALLLLNGSCKVLSNNLHNDVLLEQLDDCEFKALRACIELEEMDKEFSSYPALMRAFATLELDEAECWFQRLSKAWELIPSESIITLLEEVSGDLISASSTSYSDVARTSLEKFKDLGKHPVFKWILSVTRDHVAQVAATTTGQPASWLRIFINPPTCKSYELMRKFSGHKQAVAAVSYTFKRRCIDVKRKQKPLSSFLVVDTSGLYMEEFARSLSKMIFDSSDALIRINMSECAGSASSGNDIEKLFDGVRRRPCVVIIFENIERANGSAICILKQILRSGYASDGSGNEINFTKSIIFILLHGLTPFSMKVCHCMRILKSSPFKAYLRATSSSSSEQDRCQCIAVLKEARDHVDSETWELVDDVALFGSQFQFASCFLMSYTRCILRETAKNFCNGRLIIYPSEVALEVIRRRAKNINGEKAVKSWVDNHVKPMLEDWVEKGKINENSVVLIDKFAGRNKLSYMIENREDHCRGPLAKKIKNSVVDIRCVYEGGKYLEQSLAFLAEKLRSATETTSFKEAWEELITLSTNALSAAEDFKAVKEKLCIPVRETDKNAATELKSAKETLGFEISEDNEGGGSVAQSVVDHVLQGLGQHSAASLLLLGLREEGKKELVNELSGKIRIFAIDMSEYSDEGSLFSFKNCPLRTFNNGIENLSLLEATREHPHNIFYFDKVEDAHVDVYGLLMSALRYGILSDEQGKDIDVSGCVFIFGSDCGNMKAIAQLAGAGEDSGAAALTHFGAEFEKWWQEKQEEPGPGGLRHGLVCKVDKVVAFDPFAIQQLKSAVMVFSGEEIRRCAASFDVKIWYPIFQQIFKKNGGMNKGLQNGEERKKERAAKDTAFHEMMAGWLPSLPDPFDDYSKYHLYTLPLL